MSFQSNKQKEIWIGLVHVKARKGNDSLDGADGAFVPMLALALSSGDFVSMSTIQLNSYDFDVIEVEDIERYEDRLKHFEVDENIKDLAHRVSERDPVVMDVFQAYYDEK